MAGSDNFFPHFKITWEILFLRQKEENKDNLQFFWFKKNAQFATFLGGKKAGNTVPKRQ